MLRMHVCNDCKKEFYPGKGLNKLAHPDYQRIKVGIIPSGFRVSNPAPRKIHRNPECPHCKSLDTRFAAAL